jgi:SAM-dependent methyltransferase
MDDNPGIPINHFDLVISIYALGCSPDLTRTLAFVCSYLKPGGKCIFSWEHPVYRSLRYEANLGKYIFEDSYLAEGHIIDPSWKGVEIVINHRKLSTFLNAIIQSGLVVDRVIECEPNMTLAQDQDFDPQKRYSIPRAQLMPPRFIVKASKPAQI